MPEKFDSGIPIYMQLIQLFRILIVSGIWKPKIRIPTVRELAVKYAVNPNTVQKALAELEREDLLYSERTAGRFVTENLAVIESTRKKLADARISGFIEDIKQLGYSEETLIRQIRKKWSENNDDND